MNLLSFSPFSLLPLAMGKVYPSISKKGQHNPAIALEGYISAYSSVIFRFHTPKSIRM